MVVESSDQRPRHPVLGDCLSIEVSASDKIGVAHSFRKWDQDMAVAQPSMPRESHGLGVEANADAALSSGRQRVLPRPCRGQRDEYLRGDMTCMNAESSPTRTACSQSLGDLPA